MRRSVYRELTTCLASDCRSAVAEFTASHHNHDVYAFVLECEPFHGALTIGINTEASLERVLRESYPKSKPADIQGLHGIRFRCQDFAFNDFGLAEETMQLLDEIAATQHDAKTDRTAERHADMLLLTLVRVVLILEPALREMAVTPEFVAFVSETDASEASRIALMRRTISEVDFDTVFPEVRAFEEELSDVALLPAAEQAKFWVDGAHDLVFDRHAPDAKRFREMGNSTEGMLETASTFGSVAVTAMLDVLEKVALEPQLNKPKSKAHRQQGGVTPTCEFAIQVIDAIRAIRLVDEDNMSRVRSLLGKLDGREKGTKTGPIAAQLALMLSELRPHVFPKPELDSRSNLLKNAKAFLKD